MEEERQHLGKPNFCKIITPSVIRKATLALPRDFVEQYRDQLSNTARLDLPVGASWCIGLKKSGHVLYLDDDWEKFMKHHSIRLGYFLFFKFKGNSRFDLSIFDLTAIEIQYPLGSPLKRSNHTSETEEEENDQDMLEYLVARGKIKLSKQDATREQPSIKLSKQDATREQPRTSKKNKFQLGKEPGLKQEGETAAAMMYKTDNPFFIAKMKSYIVGQSYTMNFPTKFGEEVVTDEAGCIEIQDSERNMWPVRCTFHNGRLIGPRGGWSKFVKEKRLQIGDVCVFELIQPSIVKVFVLKE